MSSDPQWASDGTQPPEPHTDPMLPAITDDMLPPLANPRVPTLDDRALAELLAELEGEDSPPLGLSDEMDPPVTNRSTADPLPASTARAPERSAAGREAASMAGAGGADPTAHAADPLAAPRLAPESTVFAGDALAAPRLAPDPTPFAAEPLAAPRLAPDRTDRAAPDEGDLTDQAGPVPLPRPDPENSGAAGPPAESPHGGISGPPPGTTPSTPGPSSPLGAISPPGQPLGRRPGQPAAGRPGQPADPRPHHSAGARPGQPVSAGPGRALGQPYGAGAGQPSGPRPSQPLGAAPGRVPGSRVGSPLGHSGVGPVVRSPFGDFRPPVARVSDVPTGLTGLTRKSRSKVGSVLFTVVFIAIFVLILIQALASVFTASAGH